MPIGKATEHPRSSFRGKSPRLEAAQPSNQVSSIFLSEPVHHAVSLKIKMLSEMIREAPN